MSFFLKTTDARIKAAITLLGYAPLQPRDIVLDIGFGSGEISAELANRAGFVVGTGLNLASYGVRAVDLQPHKVIPLEGICEQLPFAEGSFDAVVMSHVLEHTANVGLALGEARRVLRGNGLLCVLVPPSEPIVVGGHVSVGWNIGQLMYVLALNGFDTQQGHFVKYGYNICGFVRRADRPLPLLRHDFGDLLTLAADGRWPLPIANTDPAIEAFDGDLQALNWPWLEIFPPRRIGRGGRLLRWLVPAAWKPKLARWLHRLSQALGDDPARVEAATVNPKVLRR